MQTTIIELEFVELPDLPLCATGVDVDQLSGGNGYLLSLWDTSCRLVQWCPSSRTFFDGAGTIDSSAIRAWAGLPRPLDAPAWGQSVIDRALGGQCVVTDAAGEGTSSTDQKPAPLMKATDLP